MIGKICKSFDIPKPYPGYRAMIANGKSPETTALPSTSDPALQTLTFHKHEDYEATVNEPPRELLYDDDIQEMLKKHRQLGPVKVAESLRNPHYLVSITKEVDDQRIKESKIPFAERDYSTSNRRPKTLSMYASDKERHRAYRIFDALIKRIVALGGEVKIIEPDRSWEHIQTVVFLGEERITSIRLREKSDRKRILDPTAKYSWDRDRSELHPSGLLILDKGPSWDNTPLAIDGKAKKLEGKLDSLVTSFIREAGELRIKRREDEERARLAADRARIQRECEAEIKRREDALEKRKAEETAKIKKLLDHSESWRRSQLVRDYLDALCFCSMNDAVAVPLDSELADYLRWGFRQADRIDPLRPSPHSVLDEEWMSPTFLQPRMKSRASLGDSEMFTACYDDLLPLIELIKLGKLHDIERWIADCKPLDLAPQSAKGARKKTPLQYAVDVGFHTVVETLLKSGIPVNGDPRRSAMGNALAKRRVDLVKLLCEFGYDARNADMNAVFATWDPEIMEHLIDRGADPEKGMPLARALIERTRTALRVFKKYKDRFATFQEQANIDLRLHCKEGNAKWVSLLLWAGADPCVRGEDDPDAKIDPDEPGATAIGYAMLGKHDDIVAMKPIKIPVDSPVMEDLFIYGCQGKALGVLESLLERGAVLNNASNGGCPGIQTILERFENNCMMGCVRHGSHFCNSSRGNDCDGCRDQLTAIELIAKHGGKWRPVDRHEINRARRALLKMTADYTLEFVCTMSKYSAADIKDVEALVGTPTIRARISHRGNAVREILDEWQSRREARDEESPNIPIDGDVR